MSGSVKPPKQTAVSPTQIHHPLSTDEQQQESPRSQTFTPPALFRDLQAARSPNKLRASTVGAADSPRATTHARTTSQIPSSGDLTTLRNNRLSLTFPIHLRDTQQPPAELVTQGRISSTTAAPGSTSQSITGTDTNFLTAIAAQERRVLELRDELLRAEADLNILKRQWAQHEASRKRDDVKRRTKLQTLPASPKIANTRDDEDGANAWMLQEMERRKAMIKHGRSSSRRVFSGSRHTRTLSLVSSAGLEHGMNGPTPPLPPRRNSRAPVPNSIQQLNNFPARDALSPTTEDSSVAQTEAANTFSLLEDAKVDREQIMKTGKKMASDLKQGLWTFFEDLRQATVGDEATEERSARPLKSHLQRSPMAEDGTNLRRRSSDQATGTKRTSPDRMRSFDPAKGKQSPVNVPDLADPSFWAEHGIISQPSTPATSKKVGQHKSPKSPRPLSDDSSEAWEAWNDSPMQHRASDAGSDSNTLPSTISNAPSPRVSLDASKKDPLPWPSLSKIGPSTLRRTASHLMSEWEKLTPSPGKDDDRNDYLGISAGMPLHTDQ